jgi:hypothetical protein
MEAAYVRLLVLRVLPPSSLSCALWGIRGPGREALERRLDDYLLTVGPPSARVLGFLIGATIGGIRAGRKLSKVTAMVRSRKVLLGEVSDSAGYVVLSVLTGPAYKRLDRIPSVDC